MDDTKTCIVCGMPMIKPEDFPPGCDQDTTDWWVHCGTKDGMYPYSALVAGMGQFLMKTQGMAEEQAKIAAKEMVDNSVAKGRC